MGIEDTTSRRIDLTTQGLLREYLSSMRDCSKGTCTFLHLW